MPKSSAGSEFTTSECSPLPRVKGGYSRLPIEQRWPKSFAEGVRELAATPERRLVFLIHGIDSRGQGFGRFIARLRSRSAAVEHIKNSISDANIVFVPLRYDPFGRVRAFWYALTGWKPKSLRRIERDIRSQLVEHGIPRASIIAHSFGTYVITKIMEENENLKFHHIIFCGSVLNDDYDWCALQGRFSSFTNDAGLLDMVPVKARWVRGLGAAGRTGFKSPCVVNRFFKGLDHSDFFSDKFPIEYWSEIVVNDTLICPPLGEGYLAG